jgi:hypothetical protein
MAVRKNLDLGAADFTFCGGFDGIKEAAIVRRGSCTFKLTADLERCETVKIGVLVCLG